MTTVPTVPAMHEHVEKRAGQQEYERQVTKDMCPVLDDQIEPGNCQKCDEHDVCA